jgi:hypothetical protein
LIESKSNDGRFDVNGVNGTADTDRYQSNRPVHTCFPAVTLPDWQFLSKKVLFFSKILAAHRYFWRKNRKSVDMTVESE